MNPVLKDKVSVTWDIHHKCNYCCPHCWFDGKWEEEGKDNLYLSAEKWIMIWKRLYDSYGKMNIYICGGEPFLYPSFIDILEGVSRMHSIEVITNGSCEWEEFIRRVNHDNVSISLSFYSYIADFSDCLEKVKKLTRNKFRVGITYIAYPAQFDFEKIKLYRESFKDLKCRYFNITSYWGLYEGRNYPDAYTQEEKQFMAQYSDNSERIVFSAKIESSKGRLCWAGGRYVLIHPRGQVYRCGSSGVVIGNITDDNLKFLEEPEICPADFCKCSEYQSAGESIKTGD